MTVSDATQPMDGPVMVSGDYDIAGLLHRIQAVVRKSGARVVVLDSATALFSPRPPEAALRNLFFQLVYALRKMQLTALILAEAPVGLRRAADHARRRGLRLRRRDRPAQHAGRPAPPPLHRGEQVPPQPPLQGRISRHDHRQGAGHLPPRRRRPAPQPRASNGTRAGSPASTPCSAGGLVRDSINLVRGPTGSGKTMLAGLYASAGARRGERVVVLRLRGAPPDAAAELRPDRDAPWSRTSRPATCS